MKVAVINDLHLGVRGDSHIFLDKQKLFYEEVFFPTIKSEDIKVLLVPGDVFDRRKYVNFVTYKKAQTMLFDELHELGVDVHISVGNHDCSYKNTNIINSVDLLLDKYDNITVYDNAPVELDLDGCKVMMSPWISPSNYRSSMEAFKNTKAQILMGHFEIEGFEMQKGRLCDHGLNKNVFEKFDAVYSGHFHHPSSHSGITYLGAPYEMNWTDFEGRRGFHIFDTETREMEFVANPFRMFHKLVYDDYNMTIDDVAALDTSLLSDTYIKVIVNNKTNPQIFDLFIERLQQAGAADVQIVEDVAILDVGGADALIDEAQDTPTILKQYMSGVEIKHDRERAELLLLDLYQEALAI